MQKMSSAEKAIEVIRAGQRIFVHGAAATPLSLLSALFLQATLPHILLPFFVNYLLR